MNDIIKVILLNFILIYFLIKKNKSVSIFLIVVLFIYLLYLRGNKLLEGQINIDEKKDEVKFMKMANLDNLLGKLLNVYEDSEQDCIGGYSDFSPCDKKCGITHKYKTYRVEKKAGLFGESCIEEDGRRKKELCDESDGIFKCITGESCQEDGDCETNNCDPKTDRCVPKKVCSNTNLDLCNKEECIDLNNHYDYAKREFKYDEAESGVKCKLEDKTDSEEEEEEDEMVDSGYDASKISLAQCESEFWLETVESSGDQLTSSQCKLKIPSSVYYETEDINLQERYQIYGIEAENAKGPGLYCKIGYKFDDHEGNEYLGVTDPITEEDFENLREGETIEGKCNASFTKNNFNVNDGKVLCDEGYWPPLDYFKELKNLNIDVGNRIPINEMCLRCYNGYQYIIGDEGNISCTACSTTTDNYNQWRVESNNYQIVDDTIPMGQNPNCFVGDPDDGEEFQGTCQNLIDLGYSCTENNYKEKKNGDGNFETSSPIDPTDFLTQCCKACESNERFNSSSEECEQCPLGQVQNLENPDQCVRCPEDSKMSEGDTECQPCDLGEVANNQRTDCSRDYCTVDDINNGRCSARSSEETTDNVEIVSISSGQVPKCTAQPEGIKNFGIGGNSMWLFTSLCTDARIDGIISTLRKDSSGDQYQNSIDFYDECCKFKCPEDQYQVNSSGGRRLCISANNACGGEYGGCNCELKVSQSQIYPPDRPAWCLERRSCRASRYNPGVLPPNDQELFTHTCETHEVIRGRGGSDWVCIPDTIIDRIDGIDITDYAIHGGLECTIDTVVNNYNIFFIIKADEALHYLRSTTGPRERDIVLPYGCTSYQEFPYTLQGVYIRGSVLTSEDINNDFCKYLLENNNIYYAVNPRYQRDNEENGKPLDVNKDYCVGVIPGTESQGLWKQLLIDYYCQNVCPEDSSR